MFRVTAPHGDFAPPVGTRVYNAQHQVIGKCIETGILNSVYEIKAEHVKEFKKHQAFSMSTRVTLDNENMETVVRKGQIYDRLCY